MNDDFDLKEWCRVCNRIAARLRSKNHALKSMQIMIARDERTTQEYSFVLNIARRFFTFVEDNLPPPIVIGCRRIAQFVPHLCRRADDIVRSAKLEELTTVATGCAVLSAFSLATIIIGQHEYGSYASLAVVFGLPIIAGVKMIVRWARNGYPEVSHEQISRMKIDLFIAVAAYAYTMVSSDWLRSFRNSPAQLIIVFLSMAFSAYMFSALCARALVRFARGFEAAV